MVISMERWHGKVAIVTGASSGIGAAIVESLVNSGLKVAGLARRKEKVAELAEKLSGKRGKLYAVKADVTKEEDILKAFEWVKQNLGPVHILVNNAGVIKKTTLIDGNTSDWKTILDTNVLGLTIATREAVRDMNANSTVGHIIHINSIAGHCVPDMPNINVYSASKYAVTALTETLRHELNFISSRIKVSSISPGLVATDIFLANYPQDDPTYTSALNIFPSLQSEDIADAVMYVLATPPHVQIQELMIKPVGEKF